ncbi:MAG: carbohydrate ABC transporter permease [Bacillota bacterium]
MDILKSIKTKVLDAFKKAGLFIFKQIPLSIYGFFKRIVMAVINFFKNLAAAKKENPEAFKRGLASFFIMGLGQFKNKERYKAYPLFIFLAVFLIGEIVTSNYWMVFAELSEYPAENTLHFFRDYGGVFTKGIWGLFTLGEVTAGDVYRGVNIQNFETMTSWSGADDSRALLGQGVIVIALLIVFASVWIGNIKDAYRSHIAIAEGSKRIETPKAFYKRITESYFAYLIIIPSVILVIFFILIPFLFSFLVAFTNYTDRISLGEELIRWDGFSTFVEIFSAENDWLRFFWGVFLWTAFYAFMSSVTVYILGLIQALIIESRFVVFKKFWRTTFILPWAIPGMIVLLLFSNVFGANQGLLNNILADTGTTETVKEFLQTIGLVGQERAGNIKWFTASENGPLARAIVIIVNLWMGFPFFMLLITGVLTTIPQQLIEAADIDGATSWQKFKALTLPWVLRATAPVMVTTFTFNFNNFGIIYFLTGGGPGMANSEIPSSMRGGLAPGETDILISWIYKLSFDATVNQFNLAAAYSILIFLMIGIVAIYQLSRLKSFWEEE